MNTDLGPDSDRADEDAAPLPPRILLADDSPIERHAAADLLRHAGYDVDEAADGRSVLLFLETRSFDLLLLDLHMPGIDGFDVLAELQRQHAELPVILMSGLLPDQIQHQMHRLPSRALPTLLLKPIDPDQLITVVALSLRGELPA